MVLYSAVASPLDVSNRFTLFALPGRPVHSNTNSTSLGSFSRATITARRLITYLPTEIGRYLFIQLSELSHGENENARALKQQQRGFEPGISRLRVRHSTTELPRSTKFSRPKFNLTAISHPMNDFRWQIWRALERFRISIVHGQKIVIHVLLPPAVRWFMDRHLFISTADRVSYSQFQRLLPLADCGHLLQFARRKITLSEGQFAVLDIRRPTVIQNVV